MGNTQSGSTLTRTTGALDSFVAELGTDIVYEKSLGSARFLKTVKCWHRNGFMVIKVFVKPDPGFTLRNYHRRLKADREALFDIPNIYNYQSFVETDKAGYIIRQWIASNLYDRISTRPFLSTIEKKWIAFQVITALRDARHHKVSHGDVKSENILVTSWNWVYLTDFASFKPTYLPLDDPSEFSYFFDTSGRRTCYVAPERFYTSANNPDISSKKSRIAMDDNEGKRDGKLTEAMDCFSVGCVIAELFLEGTPLFTLSQLFKYRSGEYVVDSQLAAIEDEGVRDMIKQMISLDPQARPTFDTLLHVSRGNVFPESFFSFLHNYVASINELPAISPFASATPIPTFTPTLTTPISGTLSRPNSSAPLNASIPSSPEEPNEMLPSDSDRRIERIWADYESLEPYLIPDFLAETVMDVKVDYLSSASTSKPFQDVLPLELYIPNRDSSLTGTLAGRRVPNEDGPTLIVVSLVVANIRNCSLPSAKVRALDVLLSLSLHLVDEAKLDRLVPYVVDLLHDDAPIVRLAAFRTLIQVLMMVTVITPSNAAIFPEYIFPNIKYLVQDPEVSVRCIYAQCITQVAETAVRYLEMGQALKAHGSFKLSAETQDYDQAQFEVSYDASLQELQANIEEHLSAFLMDPSSVVKRAVLHDISYLCIFLGRQKTNDLLLSHMITFLNDRDWLLRYAFFDSIVDVAACAGGRSLEEYILPLMIQALSDTEETVVAKVLAALTSLCELGLFQKMRIWELMSATLGFLYHPNVWIRQGSAAFIISAAKHLPASDVWCILYPSLRHFLRSELVTIDEQSLVTAMKSPVSRQIFDVAVQWAMKSERSLFWKGSRRIGAKSDNPRDSVISLRRGSTSSRARSEEDNSQITKLQQLGMSSSEENKLTAMRDYITKLASAISSSASRSVLEQEAGGGLKTTTDVKLLALNVVPQTVFMTARVSEAPFRSSRIASYDILSKIPGSPRPSRDSNGAPFEDLRRRLATINASASSLSVAHSPKDVRSVSSPVISSSSAISTTTPGVADRPVSPTESVLSTTNSSTFRPLSRMQIGSIDGHKAAPAIGSSRANATGLLDLHSRLHSEGSGRSGRSSPMPISTTVRMTPQVSQAVSTYDGHEPGISNLLENLYLDNNRELQQDFGPRIREGPIRRRNPGRHSFARDDSKKIEATLVAHLTSHADCVTGLAVSPDHMFFVSSSNDKTLKIWDTARLERNVTTKPRHTYGQHHARVKCVCMLEASHCFASAAEDGSLHVVRVYTSASGNLPKYSKLQTVREHRVKGVGEYITSMMHYNTETSSTLVYATTHSHIVVLDLRTMQVLQSMENPRHFGPITSLCVDRKRCWILVGTTTGVLTLWDRRFGLHLKNWHVAAAATGRAVRIHQCVIHPSKGRGKWVMVTVEGLRPDNRVPVTLVEVWDIEKSVLVETFLRGGASTDPVPQPQLTGLDAKDDPASAIAALVRSKQAEKKLPRNTMVVSPSPNVRAIAVGVDFGGHSMGHPSYLAGQDAEGHGSSRHAARIGFVLTGSEDRRVRLWDLGKPERSTVLSGPETENEAPSYSSRTDGTASTYLETWSSSAAGGQSNRAQQRISLITHNQQNLLSAHQDVITSLACIDSPFRGGVVSGDRAGVIKVWRVDSTD